MNSQCCQNGKDDAGRNHKRTVPHETFSAPGTRLLCLPVNATFEHGCVRRRRFRWQVRSRFRCRRCEVLFVPGLGEIRSVRRIRSGGTRSGADVEVISGLVRLFVEFELQTTLWTRPFLTQAIRQNTVRGTALRTFDCDPLSHWNPDRSVDVAALWTSTSLQTSESGASDFVVFCSQTAIAGVQASPPLERFAGAVRQVMSLSDHLNRQCIRIDAGCDEVWTVEVPIPHSGRRHHRFVLTGAAPDYQRCFSSGQFTHTRGLDARPLSRRWSLHGPRPR